MMNNHSNKSKAKLWVTDQLTKLEGGELQELLIKNKFQMINLNPISVLPLRKILKIVISYKIYLSSLQWNPRKKK